VENILFYMMAGKVLILMEI